MSEILDKMLAADVIVMATPVYFYTMSAQMKTLIDRCCGLYTQMQNKEFYFIVTAAEDDQKKIERTIDTFQGFLDCLDGATIKGVVYGMPGRSKAIRRCRRLMTWDIKSEKHRL